MFFLLRYLTGIPRDRLWSQGLSKVLRARRTQVDGSLKLSSAAKLWATGRAVDHAQVARLIVEPAVTRGRRHAASAATVAVLGQDRVDADTAASDHRLRAVDTVISAAAVRIKNRRASRARARRRAAGPRYTGAAAAGRSAAGPRSPSGRRAAGASAPTRAA